MIDRNIAVINFKADTPFEVNLLDEGKVATRTYSRFDSRTVPGILYLGFDSDGSEYFSLNEYETGSDSCVIQWDIRVYGTETLGGGYNIKRMIISAGRPGESTYYEFVPAGK